MKVGLFFGSFNPIHVGHLIIANHFLGFSELEEIWFVVSPHNPLKEEKSLLPEALRLKIVKSVVSVNRKLDVCDAEFDLPRPSYTINTLNYLKSKHPWYNFYIIMGSDSFNGIKKWKDYKFILTNYPIYIYKRRGFPVTDIPQYAKVDIFDFPFLDISATYVRDLIKDKKSVQFLVPEKAFKILEEEKLVRS